MSATSSTKTTFLYVIAAFDLIKVGTSRDPERRARAIYGQLLHMAPVQDDQAANAEAYAHSLIIDHQESSEWFTCSPAAGVRAIKDSAARAKAGLSLETPNVPGLANSKRGLIRASQRRADATTERLKLAIELWFDPHLTVREISQRVGLSRHTLYDHLPPRSEARDKKEKGKKHV